MGAEIQRFVEEFVAHADIYTQSLSDVYDAIQRRFGPQQRHILDGAKVITVRAMSQKSNEICAIEFSWISPWI